MKKKPIFSNITVLVSNKLPSKNISLKIRTFAHAEYNKKCFFDTKIIKKKIIERRDLFNRERTYKKILINKKNYPKFIYNSLSKFRSFIEK